MDQNGFGKWRSFFWPIHSFEIKKLLPMLLLFFFINFNYTVLRDTKDTLILTAPNSGAETIPFLKFWGVLPMALAFMLAYSKLSNVLSKQKLFISTIAFFALFFILFATVFYPLRDKLHPNDLADRLQELLPAGCAGFVACYRNWTYSLFYILSELWGSVTIGLLFWGFANDITKVSESKRFYTLFGLGAACAMYPAGLLIRHFAQVKDILPRDVDGWQVTLNYTLTAVIVACLAICALYLWIDRKVLSDPLLFEPSEIKKRKSEKTKLPLKESLLFLIRSPYLGSLAILLIGYGISINLVEVTWKGQVKIQYPNPNDLQNFFGGYSIAIGFVEIFMMLFIGGNVIRRFGWTIGALFTPVILLITGLGFFSFIIFSDSLTFLSILLQTTPLMMAVIFGSAQNCLSKACKYSLFDPTKEMAYIPLDSESKVKGKAAIDVVASRFGKSSGSFIQQTLIITFGSLGAITPYIGAILFVIIGIWIVAARSLGKRFNQLTLEKEQTGKVLERVHNL